MERNDFWKHNELFKRAMADGNTNEARHELYQMTQLYGTMIDNDLTGNKAILHAALSLDKVIVDFNMAYFVPFAMRLADTDWEGTRRGGRVIPSIGQRITNRLIFKVEVTHISKLSCHFFARHCKSIRAIRTICDIWHSYMCAWQ